VPRRATASSHQWNSHSSMEVPPSISAWDAEVARLGIAEPDLANSKELRAFAQRYRNTKFIPEHFIRLWGIKVELD
jgi:hypothetical protein